MTTNYLILGLALGGAVLAIIGFIWTVRSGQLDDLDTPQHRILLDEAPPLSAPRPSPDASTEINRSD